MFPQYRLRRQVSGFGVPSAGGSWGGGSNCESGATDGQKPAKHQVMLMPHGTSLSTCCSFLEALSPPTRTDPQTRDSTHRSARRNGARAMLRHHVGVVVHRIPDAHALGGAAEDRVTAVQTTNERPALPQRHLLPERGHTARTPGPPHTCAHTHAEHGGHADTPDTPNTARTHMAAGRGSGKIGARQGRI